MSMCQSFQSCLTLCNLMGHSLLGSSVHRILQGRKPDGVALPSSRGYSCPRNQTCISCLLHQLVDYLTLMPPGMPNNNIMQNKTKKKTTTRTNLIETPKPFWIWSPDSPARGCKKIFYCLAVKATKSLLNTLFFSFIYFCVFFFFF